MRSSVPIEGNPWPPGMSIEVADSPGALLELLWIREAWQLEPVGDDLPPLLGASPLAARREGRTRRELNGWAESWPSLWRAVLRQAGTPADHSLLDRVQQTAEGSPERRELLTSIIGPTWREEFGDAALAAGYSEWSARDASSRTRSYRKPLAEHPERIALDALIPAWRSGLAKIVTIPCTGDYTRVIGPNAMIMTAETRSDAHRYRSALGAFR